MVATHFELREESLRCLELHWITVHANLDQISQTIIHYFKPNCRIINVLITHRLNTWAYCFLFAYPIIIKFDVPDPEKTLISRELRFPLYRLWWVEHHFRVDCTGMEMFSKIFPRNRTTCKILNQDFWKFSPGMSVPFNFALVMFGWMVRILDIKHYQSLDFLDTFPLKIFELFAPTLSL